MIKTNIDAILASLKEKGIDRHIICPSVEIHVEIATKIKDIFQNTYTSVDERSAGYIATGMCAEVKKPVVIWCDGNASFRNLASALTEAFYRKMPILVMTLRLSETAIDQSVNPEDVLGKVLCIPEYTSEDVIEKAITDAYEFVNKKVSYPVLIQINGQEQDLLTNQSPKLETIEPAICKALSLLIPKGTVLVVGNDYKSIHWIETEASLVIEPMESTPIDGRLSILVGSAAADFDTLHVGIFSEREVIYDLNMFGNRHIDKNIIIIVPRRQNEYTANIANYAKALGWNYRLAEDISSLNILKIADAPQLIEIML